MKKSTIKRKTKPSKPAISQRQAKEYKKRADQFLTDANNYFTAIEAIRKAIVSKDIAHIKAQFNSAIKEAGIVTIKRFNV